MEVGTTENSSAITNTKNMEVGTTENSSAIIHIIQENMEVGEQMRVHL